MRRMIVFLGCAWLIFVLAAKTVTGILSYGPTEVQQLAPCNSAFKLTSNFQTTTIFQLDALDAGPQPVSEDFNATSCAFFFEGPQNSTLTFQLFGVLILRDSPFPNNTAPCLATPVKSSIKLYDYTADGDLQLISITCQNETWSEKFSTTTNVGLMTTTISGHFALSVQRVYAAQPDEIIPIPFQQIQ